MENWLQRIFLRASLLRASLKMRLSRDSGVSSAPIKASELPWQGEPRGSWRIHPSCTTIQSGSNTKIMKKSLFLKMFLLVFVTTSVPVLAQSGDGRDMDDVVDPGLERRRIREDKIDAENFEVGVFAGVMNIEDFGSNNVFGGRLAYHINEDFFVEALYGQTKASETSYETLSGATELLTEDQRELTYYNASIGYNVLPGEVFLGKSAYNTNFYLVAGVGNTMFADDEYFTYNFGGGFRFFATDWLALRVDFRNHIFSHSLLGEEKAIQNLETHLGATIYF